MSIKHYAFFLSALVLSYSSQCQIISSSFPAAGTTRYYANAGNIFTYHPDLNTSSSYTWNFEQAQNGGPDTISYLAPAQTGYGSSFPSANVAISEGSAAESFLFGITFFSSTGNGVAETGFLASRLGGTSPIPLVAVRNLKWLEFPFNYGAAFADTGEFRCYLAGASVGLPQYDSLKGRLITYRTDTLDGFGTIKLPGHTFNNVYRNNIRDIAIDTLWSYTPGSGWTLLNMNTQYYQYLMWLANDSNFIVAQAGLSTGSLNYVRYIPTALTNKLSIQGLQATSQSGQVISPFQVAARNIHTGLTDTTFTDSVHVTLFQPDFTFSSSLEMVQKAVKGIATFDTVKIIDFLHLGGPCYINAYSPSAISDTGAISVFSPPVTTRFNGVDTVIAVEQNLRGFTVSLITQGGTIDSLFTDTVYIGKLDGPGEILGPVAKPATTGVVVFDSIHFSWPGIYKLIAYNNGVPNADTVIVDVDSIPGVSWSFLRPDTISTFVDRAAQFVWTYDINGYLSGTCSQPIWTELAQRFDLHARAKLKAVELYLADLIYPNNNPTELDTFYVKIYTAGVQVSDESGFFGVGHYTDELPVQLLGTYPFTTDSIVTGDYFNRKATTVAVNPPLDVSSGFLVSVVTNTPTAHDTIIMWTSTLGDGHGEHRTCRLVLNDTTGQPQAWVPDYLFREGTPGNYDVDLMIEPVLDVDTIQIDTVFQFISTVTDIKSEPVATLYPNPASNHAVIKFSGLDDQTQITLFTLDGREVEHMEISPESSSATLDVSGLQSGLYLVNIRSGKWNRSFKLVIAR